VKDGATLVPLAFVIESLERAYRRADAAHATLRVLRLSVDLPVLVEQRGRETFVRFPRALDARTAAQVARLKVSIGPGSDTQVIVEHMRARQHVK
jgi:hypothetical protein